jgi:archaellum component FlaF (FlaF/FlaG flagellin family)
VFTLINVDRPGATSSLEVPAFSTSQHVYEYLPATFNVQFHNTGNTILQPYGNVFVQRTASSKTPLATLVVNETKGYILPGSTRTVSAQWNDGFATYQPVATDGSTRKHLQVDWSKLSHFRIGRYTAKLVAVYSDGQHDIPIEGTVTFWVIPWRAILLFIVTVVGLWLFARWRGKRRTEKAVKRALAAQAASSKSSKQAAEKHEDTDV